MRLRSLVCWLCCVPVVCGQQCTEVYSPTEAVQLFADAANQAVCVRLKHLDLAFRAWSFKGYNLTTAPRSDVTLDCSGARISGLYSNPIIVGDNSSLTLQHCDVYSYEGSRGVDTELQAFLHPTRKGNGASFYFLDSFRFWPCNEVRAVYMRAFKQYDEDPGDEAFEMGPIVTAEGATAFTFIDTHPFRITRQFVPLVFRNVTYYCGALSTRWKVAVAAMRAAESQGHTAMGIKPGDFPSSDPLPSPADDESKSPPIAIIIGTVLGGAVVVSALVVVALFAREHSRRARARHAAARDSPAVELPAVQAAALLDHEHFVHIDDGAKLVHGSRDLPSQVAPGGSLCGAESDIRPSVHFTATSQPPAPMHSWAARTQSGFTDDTRARVFEESESDLNLMSSVAEGDGDGLGALSGSKAGHPSDGRGVHFVQSSSTSEATAAVSSARVTSLVSRLAMDVSGLQNDIGDGQLVKHYLIGAGAFSLVYRGTWRDLDVAVKAVVFEGNSDSKGARRIVSEAAIAMSIAHENIVGTYTHDIAPLDQSSTSGNLYKLRLVQEYCNGGTLSALLRDQWFQQQLRSQRQPMRVELRMLLAVARALRYLHSKAVVHADLKGANVLIKYDETLHKSAAEAVLADGGTLKVMDFGLSQRLREKDPHLSFFNAGTRWYAAPEVVSESHLFLASDVYSFGVMAWEIVTHSSILQRLAPDTASGEATARASRADHDRGGWARNAAFPDIPESVPEPLRALVAQCLRVDQDTRPNFKEIVEVLEALVSQAVVES